MQFHCWLRFKRHFFCCWTVNHISFRYHICIMKMVLIHNTIPCDGCKHAGWWNRFESIKRINSRLILHRALIDDVETSNFWHKLQCRSVAMDIHELATSWKLNWGAHQVSVKHLIGAFWRIHRRRLKNIISNRSCTTSKTSYSNFEW